MEVGCGEADVGTWAHASSPIRRSHAITRMILEYSHAPVTFIRNSPGSLKQMRRASRTTITYYSIRLQLHRNASKTRAPSHTYTPIIWWESTWHKVRYST